MDKGPFRSPALSSIVLASRASGCHLVTQPIKNHPSEHAEFLKISISNISHLYMIPMTLFKDSTPYSKVNTCLGLLCEKIEVPPIKIGHSNLLQLPIFGTLFPLNPG